MQQETGQPSDRSFDVHMEWALMPGRLYTSVVKHTVEKKVKALGQFLRDTG